MNKGRRARRGGEAEEKRRCVTSPRPAVEALMALAAAASEYTNRKLFPKYEIESGEPKAANGNNHIFSSQSSYGVLCLCPTGKCVS